MVSYKALNTVQEITNTDFEIVLVSVYSVNILLKIRGATFLSCSSINFADWYIIVYLFLFSANCTYPSIFMTKYFSPFSKNTGLSLIQKITN